MEITDRHSTKKWIYCEINNLVLVYSLHKFIKPSTLPSIRLDIRLENLPLISREECSKVNKLFYGMTSECTVDILYFERD